VALSRWLRFGGQPSAEEAAGNHRHEGAAFHGMPETEGGVGRPHGGVILAEERLEP